MRLRTLGAVVLALLLCPAAFAQTPSPPSPLPPAGAPPRSPSPAMPPRDTSASAATGTGRIRGRVVAADTGNPLPKAQIRLSSSEARVQQVALTDADGRFEFASLPAARYSIDVVRAGYVSLQYGQRRAFEPGRPLQLTDGQIAEKIDFALPRGSVITGKITDEFGEPLPGVRMQAQRYVYQPGGQRRLVPGNTGPGFFNFVTDDLGQFRVYGLMPGTYVLSATPTMNATMTIMNPASGGVIGSVGGRPDANDGYVTSYYPGTANVDEAQTITVGLSQETSAFFSLVAAKMARITGFVRSSQGRPAERVTVMLRTQRDGMSSMSGGTMTGPDGSFGIPNVPPGEHFLEVRPANMGGMNRPGGQPADAAADEFASVPITVNGQDITGVVVTTGRGAAVSGSVIFDGSSPRPPASQQLRVFPSSADAGGMNMPMMMGPNSQSNGIVDDSGRFQLSDINGRVLFRLGAPNWFLKSVTLNGADITDAPFEAKPGSTTTGVEITLTDRQTSVSGLVKDSRGQPVKDFVAVILPAEPKDGMVATRFTRTARPDTDGKYQVRGLPPGDYVGIAVESLEQSGEWDPAFQQLVKPRGKAFTLVEGQSTALDLPLLQ